MPAARKPEPSISVREFNQLLLAIPAAIFFGIRAERISAGDTELSLAYSELLLRPGGTHSGPSLMAAIDLAMYAAVLSVDRGRIDALTSQMSINFLQRPPAVDLVARCTLLNSDPRSVVGRSVVFPHDDPSKIVCISTCTFTTPPAKLD